MAFKQILSRMRIMNATISVRHSSSEVFRKVGFKGYAMLTVPIATFCLGTWQVKRRSWKLSLIEDVKKRSKDPVIDLPENIEQALGLEYQQVRVRGVFDHSREMYVGPRQPVVHEGNASSAGGIMSSQSKIGYLVVTPFHLTDRNFTILVNRGWVSKQNIDPSTRMDGQVTGEVELTGMVRMQEKRPPFCPKNKSNSSYFLYRNIAQMAEMTGSVPLYLDVDMASMVDGGPIGGQTRMTFRNEHLSYIITWYSLCAATIYMWYMKFFRKAKVVF